MDAMSNDILKLTKRDKSKNRETLEPKNVKFDFEWLLFMLLWNVMNLKLMFELFVLYL